MKTKEYLIEFASATASDSELSKRCEAVALRLDGWILADVADEMGCSEKSVSRWTSAFMEFGIEGLCAISRTGRPPIISNEKLRVAKSVISASQSHDRPARGEDLQKWFSSKGIMMGLSSVYNTLHRLNFSYKSCRPIHPNRDNIAVEQWKVEFPKVLEEVQEQNPEKIIKVFFQDETRFGQQGILAKQWSPVGERPIRERQVSFGNGWIFGAACPQTGQKHFLVAEDIGTGFMQYFINTFSKTLGRGVHAVLVLDNAAWHTTSSLTVPKNVTLHFLPPYSPELNPIENLWAFMKSNFLCNKIFRSGKEIIKAGVSACKKVTSEMIMSVEAIMS